MDKQQKINLNKLANKTKNAKKKKQIKKNEKINQKLIDLINQIR